MTKLERMIFSYFAKLKEDNQYILLSYAHDLYDEQKRDDVRDVLIQDGKNILSHDKFTIYRADENGKQG